MQYSLTGGINIETVRNKLAEFPEPAFDPGNRLMVFREIFSFLDFTTLDGTDNRKKVKEFCIKAMEFGSKGLPFPAAVCIYPPFVSIAKQTLRGTPIRVATTAAAFPGGQMVLPVKLAEIDYVVSEGADEVDVVISRGTFLEGEHETVYRELTEMRAHCKNQTLKVILETGELGSVENIAAASEIAIRAGADFIKTSTGKISPAATPESTCTMLMVIRNHFDQTGKKVGLKPAGGIAEPVQALAYYSQVSAIAGNEWLNPGLFRIGASRLADKLIEKLL